MNRKPILFLLCAFILAGCELETEVKDETSTDKGQDEETTTTSLSVVPYYADSYVSKAEVYFDSNSDNTADEDEYLGNTDSSGVFQSSSLDSLFEKYPSASLMVYLKEESSVLLDKGDYIDHSVWLSYDLDALTVSSASTTTLTLNVNALTTWMQSLINNEGFTAAEAQAHINETLSYSDDLDSNYLAYDEYYMSAYLQGLELAAQSNTSPYCCVDLSVPEFTKIATRISWSYDEIVSRGEDPDTGETPVFEYDTDGNLVIEIPTFSADEELENGTYEPTYSGDGEFINEEGELPTLNVATINTTSMDLNTESDIAYTMIDDKVAIAYTSKSTGRPSIASLAVNAESGAVSYSTIHEFSRAGSTSVCNSDAICTPMYSWPNRTRDILAFNSWTSGEAILNVSGPTQGAFIYRNGAWSDWEETNGIQVWNECYGYGENRTCTPHSTTENYLDTVHNNTFYGPTGFYDYETYGSFSDDRLTYRGALRVHKNGNQTVGSEGDFLLVNAPVYTIKTFRARGSIEGPLFGWFNEREDSIRGLAIKKDGQWQSLAENTYDQVNTMYSNAEIEPMVSAVVDTEGDYLVATVEVDPVYDLDLNIENYKFYVRKYDSSEEMWWQTWVNLNTEDAITSMDVVAFSDGGILAATCNVNNVLTFYRWSTKETVSGLGLLEAHETQETCTDIEFLEGQTATGNPESIVLVNGNMLYGVASDGGYVKLSDSVRLTQNLRWFSLGNAWVLTGNTKDVMVFSK